MSDEAKSLLHYANLYRDGWGSDLDFNLHAARTWAAYIIGYGV